MFGLFRRFGRRQDSGLVSVGWAVQCCGEHLYSAAEVEMHNRLNHMEED